LRDCVEKPISYLVVLETETFAERMREGVPSEEGTLGGCLARPRWSSETKLGSGEMQAAGELEREEFEEKATV
jgi:hypothetical protein